MTTVTADIVIARPPEVVFSWLADLARHRQFMLDGWTEYRVTTPQSSSKGARASFRARWGQGEAITVEIAEVESPSRLALRSTAGELALVWTLTRSGDSTRAALRAECAPSNDFLNRLLSPLVTSARLRADTQQMVERLKALCEGSER